MRGDAYANVISERLSIPTDSFPEIAISNARKADPHAAITFREKRTVNGVEVWFLKMDAQVNGIPFTYMGFYYGGKAGAIQVLTFTGKNLAAEYEADFVEFLNGFSVAPEQR